MILDLTEQEAESLAALLDVATKAEGLRVAGSALHFFNKIKTAAAAKAADTPADS